MKIFLQFISKWIDKSAELPYTAIHQPSGVHAVAKYFLKRSLLKAFLAGAFLFPQTSSQAGVWVLYQYWNGTTAIQVGDGSSGDGVSSPWNITFGPGQRNLYDPFPIGVSAQSPSFYNTQVQIISQLRWSRNTDGFGHEDPYDNPPARVYLLQSYGAGASAWSDDAMYATLSASDGMGDAPIKRLTDNQGTLYNFINSSGSKIVAIDTYGDETITLPAVDLSASVSMLGGRTIPQGSRNLLFASVASDCKPVAAEISSDIEPSFNKSTIPDQTGSLRQPNVRNDNGSITVDTAVTWIPGVLHDADGQWVSEVAIHVSQNAFQNPIFAWTSSWKGVTVLVTGGFLPPSKDISALTGDYADLGLQFDKLVDANSLNQPVTFTTTAKDADNQVKGDLSNTYTINFHLPYENWHKWKNDDPPTWQDVTVTASAPGFANKNGGIAFTYQFSPAYWADVLTTAGTDIFTVLGDVPTPYAALCAALSLGSSALAPVKSTSSANFNDCWNDPDSLFTPPKTDKIAMEFYQMTPQMQVGYVTHNMEADNYDFHGYVGQVRKAVSQWNNSQKVTGAFEASQFNSGGPPDFQSSPSPIIGTPQSPVVQKK